MLNEFSDHSIIQISTKHRWHIAMLLPVLREKKMQNIKFNNIFVTISNKDNSAIIEPLLKTCPYLILTSNPCAKFHISRLDGSQNVRCYRNIYACQPLHKALFLLIVALLFSRSSDLFVILLCCNSM